MLARKADTIRAAAVYVNVYRQELRMFVTIRDFGRKSIGLGVKHQQTGVV